MKTQKLVLTLFAFVLISWPSYSFAGQGCCSHHGGQSYCDTSVGSWVCNDGTYSPTCGCTYIPPTPKVTTPTRTTTTTSISKPADPINDTTDYKALSASLQAKIDSSDSQLKVVKDNFDSKEKKIDDLNGTISLQKFFLWITSLAALGFAIAFYNKKFTS